MDQSSAAHISKEIWIPQGEKKKKGDHDGVYFVPKWKQRFEWLMPGLIPVPSAEGHEKMSVMIPLWAYLLHSAYLLCPICPAQVPLSKAAPG